MNKWEMLILGWCLGSVGTAFVVAWWVNYSRNQCARVAKRVRQERWAKVAELEADLQRAYRANLDAIMVGFEIGSAPDDPEPRFKRPPGTRPRRNVS